MAAEKRTALGEPLAMERHPHDGRPEVRPTAEEMGLRFDVSKYGFVPLH